MLQERFSIAERDSAPTSPDLHPVGSPQPQQVQVRARGSEHETRDPLGTFRTPSCSARSEVAAPVCDIRRCSLSLHFGSEMASMGQPEVGQRVVTW